MVKVLDLYEKLSKVPVVGKKAFSLAVGTQAPYFLTANPKVVELRPNYAEVEVPNWWGNHNHIGTVHVIALANGLEMAMGVLAEATIPSHLRWIPRGMNLDYVAMANTKMTAIAETDPADWQQPGDVNVRVKAVRTDGVSAVEGVIRLYVSEKPKKK